MKTTLPVQLASGLRLDPKEARELGESLAGEYCFAEPYPHIVIDDFLPAQLIYRLREHFPDQPLASDTVFKMGYAGHLKRQIFPEECSQEAREAFSFFNSAPFLQFLEGLTTIEGLAPDPYFTGGGFHETLAGGKLGVHADFRINAQLHMLRRLNVIIYLNEPWDDAWNGHLEIWDRTMSRCCHKIAPLLNRCVIFNTESDTYHGHPDPLNTPTGVPRRSVALYYYTASKAVYEESPDTGTLYAPRPGESGASRREALSLRRGELARDLLPPLVWRSGMRAVRLANRLISRAKVSRGSGSR
jgi:hypothetical protein